MSVLVMDCPHCFATRSTFKTVGSSKNPHHERAHNVFLECPHCFAGIVAAIFFKYGVAVEHIQGAIDAPNLCASIDVFPKPAQIEMPGNIPDNVARIFNQAAESKKHKHYDAACGMYRKAMELALKAHSPDIEEWKLEKRIDKLASESRITPELQAWAHELRLDGNEALHSDGEADQEMTEQMHELCKFLLLYLYTLPAQVSAAKARRGNID